MTDFSRLPAAVLAENLERGFAGLHFMQGVPILDRDLNLLQDFVNATVRGLVSRYIGSGFPLGSDAFTVREIAVDNDFQISAGSAPPGFCLVDGFEVSIKTNVNYRDQSPLGSTALPQLNTPAEDRTDTVFLEAFVESVDTDDILHNEADIALQTSVRLRPTWRVRVAEGGTALADVATGHQLLPLAKIARKGGDARIRASMITDTRKSCLSLPTVHQLLIRPAITSLSTNTGGPAAAVTILGRNLDLFGKPRVLFGTVEASDVSTPTPTSVAVKVPTGMPAGTVKVTLNNGGGSAEAPALFKVVTA